MDRSFMGRTALWTGIYLFVVLAPLFALLLGDHPPARDFLTEFAAAIAYAGLSIMGLQFGLTARFRFITQPWGEDIIYYFHRQLTWVALALVFAHPAILIWVRPARIAALNVFEAGWRVKYAHFSIYALVALTALAYGRKRIGLSYEAWHATHIVLALLAIGFGLLHAITFGHYLQSPLKAGLWVALVIVWIGVFVYTRFVRPYFLLRRPYRIEAVRRERGDSVTLSLAADGHEGLRFAPGQFAWLSTSRRCRLPATRFPWRQARSERTDGSSLGFAISATLPRPSAQCGSADASGSTAPTARSRWTAPTTCRS